MVELVALVVTVMLPAAFPTEEGVKVTFSTAVCPGLKFVPFGMPLRLKPGPDMLIFKIVTGVLLEFVKLSVTVLLSPKATLPRFRLDAFALNCPSSEFEFGAALVTPVQPDWNRTAMRAAETSSRANVLFLKEKDCAHSKPLRFIPLSIGASRK
jgi:hypothetical protein